MPAKKLFVLPNPSHALDHEGTPAGAVQFENALGDNWIGAVVDFAESVKQKRTIFIFDLTTVVEVPITAYYARKVADGELLPADAETARICGVEFAPSAPKSKTVKPAPSA